MITIDEFMNNVKEWAVSKGLDKTDYNLQVAKGYEEFGELNSAWLKGKDEELKDAIGDIAVVIRIYCLQRGIELNSLEDIKESINYAEEFTDDGENPFGFIEYLTMIGCLKTMSTAFAWLYKDIEKYNNTIGTAVLNIILSLKRIAELKGWSIEECLDLAWNTIKDRKGKTINGTFVKSEDL